MNALSAAEILRAEVDLLPTIESVFIIGVSVLLAGVVFGVWRLCAIVEVKR